MIFFNFLNIAADKITWPFQGLNPVLGLLILSLITAFILLNIFKKLSNQKKIKQHKNKVFGHFLEIAIYRDHFSRTLFCQVQALKHNILYMRYFMTPILVMMLPMLLICLQLDYRLGSSPFKLGESFIISAELDKNKISGNEAILNEIDIETSEGIVLETPALRVPGDLSLFWRARVKSQTDNSFIRLFSNNESVIKNIATKPLARFSQEKLKIAGIGDILLTGEDSIDKTSIFKSIKVSYTQGEYPFFKWKISPIVYYFILTLTCGLLIKPFVKVNI